MLGESDRTVAGQASSALSNIDFPVVEPLLKILDDGFRLPPPEKRFGNNEPPDPNDPLTLPRQRRNDAAGVLGNLKEPRAIELLLDALESDDRLSVFGHYAR